MIDRTSVRTRYCVGRPGQRNGPVDIFPQAGPPTAGPLPRYAHMLMSQSMLIVEAHAHGRDRGISNFVALLQVSARTSSETVAGQGSVQCFRW